MKSNNQINVPQAKEAMDKFKMQAAQEVGDNLTNGYNGHLTSREAAPSAARWSRTFVPYEHFWRTVISALLTSINTPSNT